MPVGGVTLEASANWSWRSMQWATITPDVLATRKAYGTLDARVGLTDIQLGNGTTLELAPPGFVATGELPANILGTRNGAEVSLVKAYEVKTRMRLAPIAYTGVVDASFSVIEGGWRIPGPQPLAGGFIMRRISSPDVMAEASAAAAARAPRRKFVSVEVKKKRARKTPIKVD